jgi:hypothetical protein
MATAEELFQKVSAAKDRIAKIGRREPHLREGVGSLSTVMVKTTVCHQDSPSAKNYWEDEAFDFALAEVVKARFASLAEEAIQRMERRANTALLEEEGALRAKLERIEQLKSATGT